MKRQVGDHFSFATDGAIADSSTSTNDVVFKLLDGEALIPDGYVWQRD